MMNPGPKLSAVRNTKVLRSISYLLVFLMMVCAVMTTGDLIQNTVPGWHPSVMAGVALFIVIDRLYTYQQLKSLQVLSAAWAISLGAQWLVIVVLIRFLLSYANGLAAFRVDLSLFTRGYIAQLFTPEFVFALLFAGLAWYGTGRFLELLDEIGLDQELALREDSAAIQSNLIPAHQRLANLIFSMGIVLVALAALTRLSWDAIVFTSAGIPHAVVNRLSGGEAGALLYFLFALTLLSLSRLLSLQTHWGRLHIPVSSRDLLLKWGMYTLLFLLILAAIASVLPAGDSLGFFSVLQAFFIFLMRMFLFVSELIISLVFLLLSFLSNLFASLFGRPLTFIDPSRLPPLPPLPEEDIVPTSSSDIWALLRSILLWGSLLVIVVLSFIQFVRGHHEIPAMLRRTRIIHWLILAWQWLYGNVERTRASLAHAIMDGWQSILARQKAKAILPRAGFIPLRSLDPRRKIYFFYLAMIRRGAEQGVARKPSQTPSEYAITLENNLPSASADIDSVTKAFVEARYSRNEVNSGQADRVKTAWERIRRAFRDRSDQLRQQDKF